MRALDAFTFPSTTAGLTQRSDFAAALLRVGRTVRFFRTQVGLFELLHLEAGPRSTEGQIARAMKQVAPPAYEKNWTAIRTHADDDIEKFNNGRR
jgi:hypothetical protein